MNIIQHLSEPNHLILAWQSPDLDGGPSARKRYSVGDLMRDGDDAVLRYRNDEETQAAKALGYRGYPAFNLDRPEHVRVLGAFMRRLPPRERTDFPKYLERFRIEDRDISDFSLLGYTEAKLPTDGFSIVYPLTEIDFPSEFLLEISGYRKYLDASARMVVGDELELVKEPGNIHDPNAVKFTWDGEVVGYVNRVQAPSVSSWVGKRNIKCVFERRNGTPERPRGYAFLTVT